jgi:hypothetical protein
VLVLSPEPLTVTLDASPVEVVSYQPLPATLDP